MLSTPPNAKIFKQLLEYWEFLDTTKQASQHNPRSLLTLLVQRAAQRPEYGNVYQNIFSQLVWVLKQQQGVAAKGPEFDLDEHGHTVRLSLRFLSPRFASQLVRTFARNLNSEHASPRKTLESWKALIASHTYAASKTAPTTCKQILEKK